MCFTWCPKPDLQYILGFRAEGLSTVLKTIKGDQHVFYANMLQGIESNLSFRTHVEKGVLPARDQVGSTEHGFNLASS